MQSVARRPTRSCQASIMSWPNDRSRHGSIDEVPIRPLSGRLWLAGKHFVAPDPDAALDLVGASSVVCLCEARELARYPGYAPWLQAHAPGRAAWWPIGDLGVPTIERAELLIADLRARLASGAGVIVHCGAGIGRAGTVAIALLLTNGVPLDEAMQIVADARAMAGPQAGTQLALLHELARRHED
jgi:protein-tyrosine phosphatase